MAQSTSAKLDPGLSEKLQEIADREGSSPNSLVNQAVSEFVERRERRAALLLELEEAHEEYVIGGRLHLTQDEVEAWMDRRKTDPNAPMPQLHP